MDAKSGIWCDRDQHKRFEYYIDFNEWLDSEEPLGAREAYGVDGISVPAPRRRARSRAPPQERQKISCGANHFREALRVPYEVPVTLADLRAMLQTEAINPSDE